MRTLSSFPVRSLKMLGLDYLLQCVLPQSLERSTSLNGQHSNLIKIQSMESHYCAAGKTKPNKILIQNLGEFLGALHVQQHLHMTTWIV